MGQVKATVNLFCGILQNFENRDRLFDAYETGLRERMWKMVEDPHWERYAEMKHLQDMLYLYSCGEEGVDNDLPNKKYYPRTYALVESIMAWKPEDVEGTVQEHMSRVEAAIKEDFEELKTWPQREEEQYTLMCGLIF
jgi:hypothetical protein